MAGVRMCGKSVAAPGKIGLGELTQGPVFQIDCDVHAADAAVVNDSTVAADAHHNRDNLVVVFFLIKKRMNAKGVDALGIDAIHGRVLLDGFLKNERDGLHQPEEVTAVFGGDFGLVEAEAVDAFFAFDRLDED